VIAHFNLEKFPSPLREGLGEGAINVGSPLLNPPHKGEEKPFFFLLPIE